MTKQLLKSLRNTIRGQLTLGDHMLLTALEESTDGTRSKRLRKLTFAKQFAVKNQVHTDIYAVGNGFEIAIQIFNMKHESPVIEYAPYENQVSHDDDIRVAYKQLPQEVTQMVLSSDNGYVEIDLDKKAVLGETWSSKESVLILLYISNQNISGDNLANAIESVFAKN